MTNKFYAHKTRYEGERKAQKPQLKTAPQHFVACKFVNTDGHRQTDRQTVRQTVEQIKKVYGQHKPQKKPNSFDSLAGGQREKSELKKKKYYYSYNI